MVWENCQCSTTYFNGLGMRAHPHRDLDHNGGRFGGFGIGKGLRACSRRPPPLSAHPVVHKACHLLHRAWKFCSAPEKGGRGTFGMKKPSTPDTIGGRPTVSKPHPGSERGKGPGHWHSHCGCHWHSHWARRWCRRRGWRLPAAGSGECE